MPPPNNFKHPYKSEYLEIQEWYIISQYVLMVVPFFGWMTSNLMGQIMIVYNIYMQIDDIYTTFDPYFTGD